MSGLAASFADEASCVGAARRLAEAGVPGYEAYTPYPVAAFEGERRGALPALVFCGLVGGLALGFFMQWYGAAVSYPLDVGGRPLASWPAFIPIAFEIAVLCAVLTAFLGFCVLARLPRLYQPVANIPGFERATQDRFFLVIETKDEDRVRSLLEEFTPCSIVRSS